jgi:PAS domain S-box-containing protein
MSGVLIVDDTDHNIYYLRTLLTGQGHAVEAAHNGAEALVKARQSPPYLVVSDLLMPVMDGYTLLRHWRADPQLRDIPFIIYTGTYTDPEDEQLALSLGADAYITKPAEPEELLACIERATASGLAPAAAGADPPEAGDNSLLKVYNEALIRKLEEKMLQLEESNRALQQDIAERKAAEAALRQRDLEFRTLIETMPHVVWIAGSDGWWVDFNQRWTLCTGMSPEDSLGHGWITAIHPDDRARMADRWRQATEAEVACEIECRLRYADGSYRLTLGRALPLRDAAGGIIKWFGTWTDIDELKQAQAQILEQATLLDIAHEAILVKDLDDRVIYWNKGAERTYGWRAAEVVGRNSMELFYKDPAPFQEARAALLAHGEWRGELLERTKDEREITVDARWTLVQDDDGQPKSILAINSDITEKKKLQAQSLRAQRMESIGALAGGIAHDLNNVLAPIVLSVDILADLSRDEADLAWLAQLQSSADRAADLVKQLLSFARGIEGQRVRVSCLRVMRDLLKVLRDTFPKSIAVTFSHAEDLWAVTGDPTQLYQVFLNLCVNARDAMPNGGSLTIRMANVVLDETYAAMHPESRLGNYVVVKVEDTGNGVRPEIRDKIFEPFFTTKEINQGTGLGLSTTLAIVNSHNGFINFYSEMGKGTQFAVYLPASSDADASDEAGIEETRLPHGNGELILVVDDEEAIRKIVKLTLERFGYRILLASNGAEAVASYVQHQTEIAAVLTDMAMSVMDGPATIVALRAINPLVKIIGSSGLMTNRSANSAVGSGVEHFVPKPYTAETLLRTLEQILHS